MEPQMVNSISLKYAGHLVTKCILSTDYNHKHIFTKWNKAKCPYTMSWELYWGEGSSNIWLKLTYFKIFSTKYFGCPEGRFLRIWVSKWHPDALVSKTMSPDMYSKSYQVACVLTCWNPRCQRSMVFEWIVWCQMKRKLSWPVIWTRCGWETTFGEPCDALLVQTPEMQY